MHSISYSKRFIDHFKYYSYRHVANFATGWVGNCSLICDRDYSCFSETDRMVKIASVNEVFVSAENLLGEEGKPSVLVNKTLERLICSLCEVKLKVDVNEAR